MPDEWTRGPRTGHVVPCTPGLGFGDVMAVMVSVVLMLVAAFWPARAAAGPMR